MWIWSLPAGPCSVTYNHVLLRVSDHGASQTVLQTTANGEVTTLLTRDTSEKLQTHKLCCAFTVISCALVNAYACL